MANYTDERDRLASIISNLIESKKFQQELARNVALEFGVMLEPMIKKMVDERIAKAKVTVEL